MNAPNHPIGAAVGSPSCIPTEAAGAPNRLTYSWRYDACTSCDTATGSRGCEECEGSGEVTSACCNCNRVEPLNDDGECADCASLVEVEWLGDGRLVA